MLGLKYEDISWDFGKPSVMDDPECMPCVFLQVIIIHGDVETEN